jgi:hypothetical protein
VAGCKLFHLLAFLFVLLFFPLALQVLQHLLLHNALGLFDSPQNLSLYLMSSFRNFFFDSSGYLFFNPLSRCLFDKLVFRFFLFTQPLNFFLSFYVIVD